MATYKLVSEDEASQTVPGKFRLVGEDGKPVQSKKPSLIDRVNYGVNALAEGMAMGYADEFAAGANAMIGRGEYEKNMADESERSKAGAEAQPFTTGALKLAGAVASPINKVIGAGANAVRAPGYLNMAIQGAAQGGLAGAGESTEGNRLSGAISGGVFGAGAGAGFPALLNGLNAFGRSVIGKFKAPINQASDRLARALSRDGMDVNTAIQTLDDLGPGSAIADLGGNVRGLAESAAQTPGKALKAAEGLRDRAFGQGERLIKSALDAVGVKSVDDLIYQRSSAARPWYERAFSQDNYRTIRSPLIERLMTRPDFQKGMRAGIKDVLDEAAITGEDVRHFNTFFEGANLDDPNLILKKEPTLRILDAAKRGMDKILKSDDLINTNGTKKQEWYRLNDMRQSLVKEIDDKFSGTEIGEAYKKAREAWAGPSDTIDALSTITRAVEKSRDGSDITGRLFGSPDARKKLGALFPDQKSLGAFAKAVQAEKTFAETNRAVSGNSRTSFRQAAQADTANGGAADVAMNIAENPSLGNALWQGVRGAKNWLTSPNVNVADELSPLYSTDPAVRNAFLRSVTQRQELERLVRPVGQGLLSGASRAGGYSGGLLGSNQ